LLSHWSNVLLQSDQKKDGDEQGHGHPEHKDDNRNQSVHWYPADDVGALTTTAKATVVSCDELADWPKAKSPFPRARQASRHPA